MTSKQVEMLKKIEAAGGTVSSKGLDYRTLSSLVNRGLVTYCWPSEDVNPIYTINAKGRAALRVNQTSKEAAGAW